MGCGKWNQEEETQKHKSNTNAQGRTRRRDELDKGKNS